MTNKTVYLCAMNPLADGEAGHAPAELQSLVRTMKKVVSVKKDLIDWKRKNP